NSHAMDQDRDSIPGEAIQDRYSATTSYFLGYRASATPVAAIDLVPGAAGVFSILDGVDEGGAAVNLGSNKFNFSGTTYPGASSLFASSDGMLTFGSAYANFLNTDLTTNPIQAAIVPLWQYWTTAADANDQVLGKFEDTTGDGVADRLIIE